MRKSDGRDYLERLADDMNPTEFKMQYEGSFHRPEEVTDDRNRPRQELWAIFDKLCYKIEQPVARCRKEAKPGDWYLSLCHGKNLFPPESAARHWYIFQKTEEGSRMVFNLRGMRAGDLHEILLYMDAFIFQYNRNMTGEEE